MHFSNQPIIRDLYGLSARTINAKAELDAYEESLHTQKFSTVAPFTRNVRLFCMELNSTARY